MAEHEWLIFAPQTPTAPSSLRVTLWRRLQHAGAVSVQQGLWMLPKTEEHEQVLAELLREIQAQGGSGFLLKASALDTSGDALIILRFQEERARNYTEFAGRCQDFFHEIDKETQAQNLTFAELEEIEEDFAKLTSWLRKIQQRDFFPSSASSEATQLLTQCREMLDTFTRAVYANAGLEPKDE
jgi:hypothetical protein